MDPRQAQMRAREHRGSDDGQRHTAGNGRAEADTSEAIRHEIDSTRAEMDKIIDEIQLRLSPRYMAQCTMETIKDNGRRAGRTVSTTIRDHPIPTAVAAIGLGWLIAAAVRDKRDHTAEHFAPRREWEGPEATGGHRMREAAGRAGERVSHWADEARERAADARGKAAELTEHARHRAADWAEGAGERARDVGHRISEGASTIACKARSGAEQAKATAVHTFREHPLTVGAAAVAAGVIAGLVIPSTRREDELMGEQRDHLVREARHRGEELFERGQNAVERAVDAATEEARRQGLTPHEVGQEARHAAGDLKERAGRVAEAAGDAAREEVRSEPHRNQP